METGGFHGYRKLNPNNHTGSMLLTSDMGMRAALPELNTTNINQSGGGGGDDECTVREQDRFMPIANVIRIMRRILPPHAKISDDAKETIQECVSEYISFITGEANERCQREQRKTITSEDILWAMSKLGFDDYIEPLTIYLHRYRELEGERGNGCSNGSMRADHLMSISSNGLVMKREYGVYGPGINLAHYQHHHNHNLHMNHHNGFFFGGYNNNLKDGAAKVDASSPGTAATATAPAPGSQVSQYEQH